MLKFPLLAALLLAVSCAPNQDAADPAAQVEGFHRLYNDGQLESLYAGLGENLAHETRDGIFAELMNGVRSRLGQVRSTTSRGVRRFEEPGTYRALVVYQDTRFERGAAHEEFVYDIGDDGRLTLAGYRVRTPDGFDTLMGNLAEVLEDRAAAREGNSSR